MYSCGFRAFLFVCSFRLFPLLTIDNTVKETAQRWASPVDMIYSFFTFCCSLYVLRISTASADNSIFR